MTIESSMPVATDAAAPAATEPGTRLNNIAELRLLFAACVVLSHAVQLSDIRGYDIVRVIMNSEVAVQGFFILSGFLVFGSYDRIRAPLDFYRRRIARIYPAYFVAVLFFAGLVLIQASVLGVAVESDEVAGYLAANLLTLNFIKPGIDSVFADNAVAAINGALWSIKVELMFYACVPALYALARRSSVLLVAVALAVAGILWWPGLSLIGEWLNFTPPEALRNQLPGQLHFFALGLVLFAFSRGWLQLATLVAFVAATLVLLVLVVDWHAAANVLGLVVVIALLSTARSFDTPMGEADISYGIYLSHFPIIQMLVAGGATTLPFGIYLLAVCGLAIAYGLASWHWVEKKALELNRQWLR